LSNMIQNQHYLTRFKNLCHLVKLNWRGLWDPWFWLLKSKAGRPCFRAEYQLHKGRKILAH
jgi:hypothetical protein